MHQDKASLQSWAAALKRSRVSMASWRAACAKSSPDDAYKIARDELTFHCYAATKAETRVMQTGDPLPMFTEKKSRWYNHVVERPYAYHFATAITRENLIKLNGFDERFAQGQDMDDVDLIYRVKELGLELKFVEDPWVVHQYHRKTYDNPHNPPVTVNNRELWASIKDNLQVRAKNGGNDICGI